MAQQTFVSMIASTGPSGWHGGFLALTAEGEIYLGRWIADPQNAEKWIIAWEPFGSVVPIAES